MLKFRIYCLSFWLFHATCVYSQHSTNFNTASKLDSVALLTKGELLNTKSDYYLAFNIDSANWYNSKAIEIAHFLENKNLIALSYFQKAKIEAKQNQYAKAISSLNISDSLFLQSGNNLQRAKSLSVKGKFLASLNKIDSALLVQKQAVSTILFTKANNLKASFNEHLATTYFELEQLDSALKYYALSNQFYKTLKDFKSKAKHYVLLGKKWAIQGKYDNAISLYIKAVEILEQKNDTRGVAEVSVEIAEAYNKNKEYKIGLGYYKRALANYIALNDTFFIKKCQTYIANSYLKLEQIDSAIVNYKNTLSNYVTGNEDESASQIYYQIGQVYLKKENFDSARHYFQTIVNNYEKNKLVVSTLPGAYTGLGMSLIESGSKQYNKAISLLEKGKRLAIKNSSSIELTEINKYLSAAYFKKGEIAKAYTALKHYYAEKDSLIHKQNKKLLSELTTLYETEKKQRILGELEKSQLLQETTLFKERVEKILWIIGALVLAFIAILVYFNFKNRQKQQLQKLLTEQQVLRNSSVIKSEEKERKRIAGDLHDSVGQMLASAKLYTQSLAKTNDKEDIEIAQSKVQSLLDSALVEVRQISHNLKPRVLEEKGLEEAVAELVRQINQSKQIKIDYSAKNLKKRLNEVLEVSCYRLVQEVVHNMIKHAEATEIKIAFRQNPNQIFLELSDNGKGFDVNQIKGSTGIGWDNIYSRVSMLNGDIKINSKKDFGTTIQFMFSLS